MYYAARVGELTVVGVIAGGCGGSGGARSAEMGSGATDSAALAATVVAPAGPRVSSLMIGRRIGPRNHITDPTFRFAPTDTVYLSVAGAGGSTGGTLTAAWRSQSGEILDQSSQRIMPEGQHNEFHLSSASGLKPGTYKVVLFLDGDSVDTRVFAVRK